MKTIILLLTTLIFSLTMFASTSFAEWTETSKNVNGDTFYLDSDRIRKVDGYVYFWELQDWLKPYKGILSAKIHRQGDCKLSRFKPLSFSYHKEPMGGGTGKVITSPDKWFYPSPNSSGETVLKKVCKEWIRRWNFLSSSPPSYSHWRWCSRSPVMRNGQRWVRMCLETPSMWILREFEKSMGMFIIDICLIFRNPGIGGRCWANRYFWWWRHQATLWLFWFSCSIPSLNLTPVMSFGNWFLPRNRSQVFSASLITLKTINSMVFMDKQPFDRLVRWRTVAKVLSMGFVVLMWVQCSAGKS